MNEVERYEIKPHFENGRWIEGRTLKIYYDEDCEDPRKSFDNLGVMVCVHRRYDFGDIQFRSVAELDEHLAEENIAVILPLYVYDHSGLVMNTSGFTCPWDSGQVGYIYATKSAVAKEFGNLSRETLEIVSGCLRAEVEIYSKWLSGECYGFTISSDTAINEDDYEDSCWGFFSIDHILEDTGFKNANEVMS